MDGLLDGWMDKWIIGIVIFGCVEWMNYLDWRTDQLMDKGRDGWKEIMVGWIYFWAVVWIAVGCWDYWIGEWINW